MFIYKPCCWHSVSRITLWITSNRNELKIKARIWQILNSTLANLLPLYFTVLPVDRSPSAQFFSRTKSPERHQKDKTSNFINSINQPLSSFGRYTLVSFHKSRLASSVKSPSPKMTKTPNSFFKDSPYFNRSKKVKLSLWGGNRIRMDGPGISGLSWANGSDILDGDTMTFWKSGSVWVGCLLLENHR